MILVTHHEVNDTSPYPSLSGEYHDIWRKVSEGWKFAKRVLYSDKIVAQSDKK